MKQVCTLIWILIVLSMIGCNDKEDPDPNTPTDPPADTTTTGGAPDDGGSASTADYIVDESFQETGMIIPYVVRQPDGKFVVASVTQVLRINLDGSVDNTFAAGVAADGEIHSLALQPDGKILVGGNFFTFNQQPHPVMVRLNQDGTLDDSFVLDYQAEPERPWDIQVMAVQSSGDILIGGYIIYVVRDVDGFPLVEDANMLRLKANGDYDPTFVHHFTGLNIVKVIKLIDDDQMYVTGENIYYIDYPDGIDNPAIYHHNIVRLNKNGDIDRGFGTLRRFSNNSPYGNLQAFGKVIEIQEDGKILLGGRFDITSTVFEEQYQGVIRLNSDGSIDTSLPRIVGNSGIVTSICHTRDGYIFGSQKDPDKNYINTFASLQAYDEDFAWKQEWVVDSLTDTQYDQTGKGDTYFLQQNEQEQVYVSGDYGLTRGGPFYQGMIRLVKPN